MAPIYRLGAHYSWNAAKKASERKSLANLVLAFMTIPLAEVDNERIFSLKSDIIGIHATGPRTELLHARARIKVHADPKGQNSVNQEQISFVIITFMFTREPISKESQ
jgi:hypothetical protein